MSSFCSGPCELFSCCSRDDKRKGEASALRGNQWILEGEIWTPRKDRGEGGRKESYFVTLRQEGENVREVFTCRDLGECGGEITCKLPCALDLLALIY